MIDQDNPAEPIDRGFGRHDRLLLNCHIQRHGEQIGAFAPDIRSRALVPVLEKFSPPSEEFHLYYPARTGMPGKLRALLDFMREANPA